MKLIERYRAGAHEEVWRELTEIGPDIRASSVAADAIAVAHETMARVRSNLEILWRRLQALDYRFGYYPDGIKLGYYFGPLVAPTPEQLEHVDELVRKCGPIPLSLETFWRVVGAVDFIGQHDLWPEYADPIVVEPPEVAIHEYAEWLDRIELDGVEEVGPFLAVIAPDDIHKDNVSGGAPYGFTFPNGGADAVIENEWHEVTFTSYLREAILGWGGFPGLSRVGEPLASEIVSLRRDLIAF